MSGSSRDRFLSTIRGPAANALDDLSEHAEEIFAVWHRQLQALGLTPRHFLPCAAPDLGAFANQLRGWSYSQFRHYVEECGAALAQRASLDQTVTAFNRLFEICLETLLRDETKRASPVLSLSRMFALAGLLVVSGYTGDWASGEKSLAEATLFESEDQIRDASAYITRVYEQERRGLARDLHDEVGHDLMLMKLHLEMIALDCQKRKKGMSEFQPRVAEALALVSHSIDSIRRIGLELGPAVFDDLGFVPAVRTYVDQFSARTKINVVLQEGYLPPTVPMAHQVALYRLIQGALANVYKHASAKNVEISLGSRKGSVLVMVIQDDGIGFDAKARYGPGSFGLTAMRERAEVLGGRVHIESRRAGMSPRQGTRIEVDLPLPEGRRR